MRIEVACQKADTTKAKGDLLEKLAKDLLSAQGYEVIEEVRITSAELDLLCKHKVNGKQIYVECKAQKDKIDSEILRKLLGTVDLHDYSEGWLISTAEFGKEAKGFVELWKSKPIEKSQKLSFYTPEKVIESLINASVIVNPPKEHAKQLLVSLDNVGTWLLVISKFGSFWAVFSLSAGVPNGALIYSAKTGEHISDNDTLKNISSLETSLNQYDLFIGEKSQLDIDFVTTSKNVPFPQVVEIQIGDSWNDYRPARPKDFVGRDDIQKDILNLLSRISDKTTETRIFAVTGNSGLGKSSLLAKLRDRSRNKHYKNKYFVFAVDIRGAKNPAYINASLLKCLQEAQANGFGDAMPLQLTDPEAPLSSESITSYLETLRKKDQVLCLVFDQFEELYSKPELFSVFHAAKSLMIDVAGCKTNFALGFAWKTDSTTHQDHPAYHMWHELSDYRKVYKLDVFDSGEISKAITIFEKEIGKKLPNELRHQIGYSCQGFPWLLKKLCINVYENLQKGEGSTSVFGEIDVKRLFESDLDELSPSELTCLKLIASKAPADWSEIIEISGLADLNRLVHKRLVIKSGDRLNIYWDIFRDFILTGSAPILPFNYIPTTDFSSFLNVSQILNKSSFLNSKDISYELSIKEGTVLNVGADLVMFGVADRNGAAFRLANGIESCSSQELLQKLRDKFGRHSLKIELYKKYLGKKISSNVIQSTLKQILPKVDYGDKTWATYANRLAKFLALTGYLMQAEKEWIVQDNGSPATNIANSHLTGKRKGIVFTGCASPSKVVELLMHIDKTGDLNINEIKKMGYRNALTILSRFNLVVGEGTYHTNTQQINNFGDIVSAVWGCSKDEPTLTQCLKKLELDEDITGLEMGIYISALYSLNWSEASRQRSGNSLRQWSIWLADGLKMAGIPTPPGRAKKTKP